MQDALSSKKGNGRSLSTGQILVIGSAILVGLLFIVGTILDANRGGENVFSPTSLPFTTLAAMAFLGGLLSFLSPCTLPILPAYFAFASQSGRGQIASNTLVFMLGVATMFSLFGAGASTLGLVLRSNQDLILIIGGSFVVVFGVMSLLGKGFTGLKSETEQVERNGLGGSFVFGLTFSAGWSSCIGPILGIMLSLAATTGSVLQGTILLFIFAVGLGLPLVMVSTFIGRLSRQSLVWRILRGKGWMVDVPRVAVSLVWAVAVWVILLAIVDYAYINFSFLSGEIAAWQTWGILAIAVLGALLWVYTSEGKNERVPLQLHTTQLFSGVLFLALGYLMLSGQMSAITAYFNNLTANADWFAELEEGLFNFFNN